MASLLLKLVLKELESRSNHVENSFSFITQLWKLHNISIQLVIKSGCVGFLCLTRLARKGTISREKKKKTAKQYAILDSVGA